MHNIKLLELVSFLGSQLGEIDAHSEDTISWLTKDDKFVIVQIEEDSFRLLIPDSLDPAVYALIGFCVFHDLDYVEEEE